MSEGVGERAGTPDEPQPIALVGGRIASLDFIRGIAVMGILVANIVSMGQPQAAYPYPGAFTTGHSPAEDWMWVAQLVLIDGKMRGLFTILFGAGLYLFMEKAWEKGATRVLQVKRLLWLGLFGLLHYYLLWQGDILFAYAVSGLIAVLFCLDLTPRQQLVLGLLGYICGVLFYGVSTIFMQHIADRPLPDNAIQAETQAAVLQMAEADIADGQFETAIRQDGSYGELVAHVFEAHGSEPFYEFLSFPFETLPLMLIGMALYRMGLFNGAFERTAMLRYGYWALLFGGTLTLWIGLATKAAGLTYYGTIAALTGWNTIPQLVMTLGYLSILIAYAPGAGGWLGARVSAAGRAAFTNYLGTSLILLLVFGNWGLDQFGKFGRTELYLTVMVAWMVMLVWSQPWLDRFRYGPLEWLWRCLTYGRLFELRR